MEKMVVTRSRALVGSRRAALWALISAWFVFSPAEEAQAKSGVSTSVGAGWEVATDGTATGTTLMIAPGYSVLKDVLRLELGVLTPVSGDTAFEAYGFRPMLIVSPPVMPFYLRGMGSIGEGGSAIGGAVGARAGLGPVKAFGELGYLPTYQPGNQPRVLEGRVGLSLGF